MVAKKLLQGALALTSVAVLAGCAQMGGGHITKGNSPSEARGGAAGSSSVNANSSLERCDAPLGTIAIFCQKVSAQYASTFVEHYL